MSHQEAPLVEMQDVKVHFPVRRGVLRRTVGQVRAVDGISLTLPRGETLGLVGESGSGKSTLARAMIRILQPTGGRVVFDGSDITSLRRRQLRGFRRRMQMVFQDPYSSLNPRMTVGSTVLEALDVNEIGTSSSRQKRVDELLELVGLPAAYANRHPHELSGGQRQRVGIARALAPEPDLIVADEAIAALDVSIQAQVVNLLDDLKRQLRLTYLFVSHDLSMVRYISDHIAVMYLGKVVEIASSGSVCLRPAHPYTMTLLSAAPVIDPAASTAFDVKAGDEVPDPANPPSGCSFHPRCPFATQQCREEEPPLRLVGTGDTERLVACHHAESLSAEQARHPVPSVGAGSREDQHG